MTAVVYQFPEPKPLARDAFRIGSHVVHSIREAEDYALETGIKPIFFVPGVVAELSAAFNEVTRG